MRNAKYSVLMSVYKNEMAQNLTESIESMLKQTILPSEIILVKDGPLTEELEKVISKYKNSKLFKIIELKTNVGLGEALNRGLKECENDFVARMDTDDISEPSRCEKQLVELNKTQEISVIGTSVVEFIGCSDNIVAYKDVEQNHEHILKTMKYRNPINHPTVMFRKKDVEEAGNYKDWLLNEDYYLWIRMAQMGFLFRNIKEPLVKMRITNNTYQRRGGWNYFIAQKKLYDYMLKGNFINIGEYFYNNSLRFFIRVLIPNSWRKKLYMKFLRKKLG